MIARAFTGAGRSMSAWLGDRARLGPDQERNLLGLTGDSREVRPGFAFLALAGARHHGLDFLPQALAGGAVAALWNSAAPGAGRARELCAAAGAAGVALPGLEQFAGTLAAEFHDWPSRSMQVIGVTGTDGKTSVTHLIAAALAGPRREGAVLGTLGHGFVGELRRSLHTTPDPARLQAALAQLRDAGARYLAMEVSSHGLDQNRVDGVEFAVAVLTNLGRDHLDYHGDLAAYGAAKARLFRRPELRALVLNLDDPFGRELAAAVAAGCPLWSYGAASDARIRLSKLVCRRDGLELTVAESGEEQTFSAPLLGEFNAANLLAAFATLRALGLSASQSAERLARSRPVPGRMEPFAAAGSPLVVVDYAHTPQALEAALRALRPHCRGRLSCVFGCGGERDRGKRPLMGAVAERLADSVWLTDDNPRGEAPAAIVAEILDGCHAPDDVRVEHDRRAAIASALADAGPADVVLVAGKGHETMQLRNGRATPFSDRAVVAALLGVGEGD